MRFAAAAFLVLLALFGAMMLSQEQLLFPTEMVPPAGPLPHGAARLKLVTSGGETLHGVHLMPSMDGPGPRTMILGFGGNGWNGQHVAEYLHEVLPAAHVVAFHYRGYRPSTGSPSADALLEDAPLVLRTATEQVKPDRTLVVGFSIGSGVAASLAGQFGVDGLVLVTPFDSLKAVAADIYPWLPIAPFFRHEIDAAGFMAGVEVPVAILAAANDEIIPAARTETLRRQVARLRFDRTIAGAGHNDLYARDEFRAALREAVDAVADK